MNDQDVEFQTVAKTIQAQAAKLIEDYRKEYPEDQTVFSMFIASNDVGKQAVVIDGKCTPTFFASRMMDYLNEARKKLVN
jgi:hypothetical protein